MREKAMEMAAQLWCKPSTEHEIMNFAIAEAAAMEFHCLLEEKRDLQEIMIAALGAIAHDQPHKAKEWLEQALEAPRGEK